MHLRHPLEQRVFKLMVLKIINMDKSHTILASLLDAKNFEFMNVTYEKIIIGVKYFIYSN